MLNTLLTLTDIIIFVFLARFHLDLARFNAPVVPVKIIRKITDPILYPFKGIFPYKKEYLTGLFCTLIITLAIYSFINIIIPNKIPILRNSLYIILTNWVNLIIYTAVISAILSWIPSGPASITGYYLNQILMPLTAPIRKFVPPVAGISFSLFILIIVLKITSSFLIQIIRVIPF